MGWHNKYKKSELEYLTKFWGRKSLTEISNELGRSKCGIHQKAKRLKLCGILNSDEYLSANQIARIMGKQANTIMRWIKVKGLKGKYKIMMNGTQKGVWRIKHTDLMKWLKSNQDKYDSRKIIPFSLGTEPKWLRGKRAKDRTQWKNRFKRWTKSDGKTLLNMFHNGKSIPELMEIFDRSFDSIERKLSRVIKIKMAK
jgi:predicted transcriptional regulator